MVTQQVLVTGPSGEAGEAILNHLAERDEHEFTYFDRTEHPEYETFVTDIADYGTIRPAFDGRDAVIHFAAQSDAGAAFEDIIEPNIMGMYNVLKAMEGAGIEKLIYASSQHVIGLYEENLAPGLYEENYPNKYDPLRFTHETLPKPDGYYGVSKIFGGHTCRTHARRDGVPSQVYSTRISGVRIEQYNHPYGDAERDVDRDDKHKVEDGEVWGQSQTDSWERGSGEYEEMIKWLRATWTSQRDLVHLLECYLEDDSVTHDTFYMVSSNKARWFNTNHAEAVLDYEPADNGSKWGNPSE